VKIIQAIQINFAWEYRVLAVDIVWWEVDLYTQKLVLVRFACYFLSNTNSSLHFE
jgi:hypothetical protein